MRREFIITADGSKTIHLPDWNEQYHSKHGAIQEALHVFIREGLLHFINTYSNRPIYLLEMGFGTGLNSLLTFSKSEKHRIKIHYTGVEAYPVSMEELEQLNYAKLSNASSLTFKELHQTQWGVKTKIGTYFSLMKDQSRFENLQYQNCFNLIYFDAFGARVQPELWTEALFRKMYDALRSPGVLVTYAAKGSVRRAMQAVGFRVERLPGPPGKREMLRATKD